MYVCTFEPIKQNGLNTTFLALQEDTIVVGTTALADRWLQENVTNFHIDVFVIKK